MGGNMPKKPKHPCAFPGCPELVEPGSSYCEKHAKERNKQYEKYKRDKDTKRRYGRSWKRIRDRYIKEHPLCEMCFAEGKAVEATEVHHKLHLAEGGTNEAANLQALCKSCHNKVHARRGDRWGRKQEYKF